MQQGNEDIAEVNNAGPSVPEPPKSLKQKQDLEEDPVAFHFSGTENY